MTTPLTDTASSNLRNALQIIEGGRVPEFGPDRYTLTSTAIVGVRNRIQQALTEIEHVASRMSVGGLMRELREMELTNRELAGDPSVLLEASIEEPAS